MPAVAQMRMALPEVRTPKFDMVAAAKRRQDGEIVERPGGLEAAPKKKRWNPIQDGRLGLVQLTEMPIDRNFNVLVPQTGDFSRFFKVKAVVVDGIHKGRWVGKTFLLEGHKGAVKATEMFLRRAVSCHYPDLDNPSFVDLDNVIVPVRFRVVPHFATGAPCNDIEALAADPSSVTFSDYLRLVRKFEDAVPGWNLYPGSKAIDLVCKRKADREVVDEDLGMTKVEIRKLNNSHRAVRKMGEAK